MEFYATAGDACLLSNYTQVTVETYEALFYLDFTINNYFITLLYIQTMTFFTALCETY